MSDKPIPPFVTVMVDPKIHGMFPDGRIPRPDFTKPRPDIHSTETVYVTPDVAPKPTDEFLELADGITLALKLDANGIAYVALPPEVQAQLDRIEAMLVEAKPKEDTSGSPDFSWISEYLDVTDIQITSTGRVHVIGTLAEVSEDDQGYIRGCFPRDVIGFEVVKPLSKGLPE